MLIPDRFRNDLHAVLLVASFALLVRMLYGAMYFIHVPDATLLYNDARAYWQVSLAMQVYGWWLPGEGAYYQAPLYPMALSLLRACGIHEISSVIVLQFALGVINSMLTYALARNVSSRRLSIAAASLYSLCHLPLFFESKILATTLGTFLFLLSILVWNHGAERKPHLAACGFGVLMALAVLARPNLLFTIPCVVIALGWKALHDKRWVIPILFLISTTITIAPVPLRNGLVGGDWVPITANAGVTLYMGTNPLAQGGLGRVDGLSDDIEEQRTQSIRIASQEAGRPLSAAEASRHWIAKTLEWVQNNPGEFLLLQGKKTLWALYHTPPAVNQSVAFEQVHLPGMWLLSTVTALMMIAGGVGAAWALRSGKHDIHVLLATLAGYMLLSWVYYASDRFLATVLPVLCVLAALPLSSWNTSTLRRKLITAGVSLVFAFVVFNPWLASNRSMEIATGWYNLGVLYEDRQQIPDALEAYQRALDANPQNVSALVNLGVLLAQQNDLAASSALFERALQIDPYNQQAQRNLQINRDRDR